MSWFDGEPEACSEEGADERDSFLLQETTNTILAVIVSLVRADCGRNTLRTVVAVRTRQVASVEVLLCVDVVGEFL